MEATVEHWEENEEVGIDLRGRLPRQNSNTITHGEDGVYTSQSSSEAESSSAGEEEGAKGSPRNGFHTVSDKNGGTESPYGISGFNGEDVVSIISKKSSGNEIVASEVESLSLEKSVYVKHQDEDYIKLRDEEVPGFGSLPSKQSIEQNGHYASLENGKAENGKVKMRDIGEQEVSELYLERVYEKPAAHEFYCPNCNSCITKVLIRNRELENRPEIIPLPEPIDTVRCNSCFSFLIPAGSWFFPKAVAREEKNQTDKGLHIEDNVGASVPSHESNGRLKDQNSKVTSVVKGSLPVESVGPSQTNLESRIGVELPVSLQDSNGTMYDKRSPTPAQLVGISQVVSVDKAPEPHLESRIGVELPVSVQDPSNGTMYDKRSPMPAQSVGLSQVVSVDKASEPYLESRIGVELPVSVQDSNGTFYDKRSPMPAQSVGMSQVVSVEKAPEPYLESRTGVELPVSLQDSNGTFYDKRDETHAQSVGISQAVSVDKAPEPYLYSRIGVEMPVSPQESNGTLYDQNPPMPAQSVGVGQSSLIDKAPVLGDFVEASVNGVQLPVPSYDSNGTLHNQKFPLPGQSVVSITVTTQSPAPEIDDAGSAESKPRESPTITVRSDRPPIISEPREAKTIDVLKSIVYGGLTEVIASISIVTSAASAGTDIVNILALALANLLGGLFIIGHHLWELKVDQSRVTSSETNEQVDRYEEVLGKRENFILHATVAILSFLIFGLVPPVVYCFSFRQSNDLDLKLAVLAASSLLCIILLAIGKAYTQRPQKYIKTLVYYVIIGVGVGGVSYIAGDLIDKLVEKLGWFSSTVAGTLPLPQMSMVKQPAWKSW